MCLTALIAQDAPMTTPTALERAEHLAAALTDAGAPGNPHVTTTGGLNLAVALTRPDGTDLIVVAIEVWADGPVYYATRYDTRDQAVEHHELTDHDTTLAVVYDMLTRT